MLRIVSPQNAALAGVNLNIKVLIRNLCYRAQYFKYVRYLPFYLARDNGVKKAYSTKQIDHSIRRYKFNVRYSPIAYALYGNEGSFLEASSRYNPHPDRNYIRWVVGRLYKIEPNEICMCKLIKFSMFKSSYHADTHNWAEKQYNKDYDRLQNFFEKCQDIENVR